MRRKKTNARARRREGARGGAGWSFSWRHGVLASSRCLLLLLVLCCAGAAEASGWYYAPYGTGLYTWTNGAANNGWLYRRYRTCGCRSTCSHAWTYRQYARIGGPSGGYASLASESWRDKLLDIAATRDRYQQQLYGSALEHNEFLETLKALGLEGDFSLGYSIPLASGAGFGAAAYGSAYSYAQQGSTQYGYDLQSFAGVSDQQVELGALFERAYRLATQAQQLGGEASADFTASVKAQGEAQAEVAKILARGQVEATNQTTSEVTITGSARDDTTARALVQPRASVIERKCLACHSGGEARGGLDLAGHREWSAERLTELGPTLLARVMHADPRQRMPLAAGGGPGEALSVHEVAELVLQFSAR